jgi:penicillin-binding protein 1A
VDLQLKDRTHLVTGGSSGVGLATVAMLLEEGANVVTCARNRDRLDSVIAPLPGSDRVLTASCDVRDPAAVAALVDAGVARFGGLDGLVNNAGKSRMVPRGEATLDDWRDELDSTRIGTGFSDWRKAVVLSKDGNSAEIGFTDNSTGTLPASAASMPKRGGGGTAFSNMRPGDIIIVKDNGGGSYEIRSIPEVSGGFLAEEVSTGRVLAMQGGFDMDRSSYNRATQAKRQPGSAFKPIVYVTALENQFTPASIVMDAPFCVWQGAALGEKCFVNFDHRSAGPHTLRWGVEQSRNNMTVRTASQTGMQKVVDMAKKLGVGDYDPYLSMALGAGETTVQRLVNAYAILANQGRAVKPTTIDYVQDRNGKVIFRTDHRCQVMGNCNAPDWDGKAMPRPPIRGEQLVDPVAAYQMVHIMEGVVERGTAASIRDLDRPLFGKTGTTNGPTNVWFVGGTPDVVAGVYVGYDQPRAMGHAAQGGRVAAPIFEQFARAALKDMPKTPFVAPAGTRMVRIDRTTGRPAFGTFPTRVDPKSPIIWEAFQPQTETRGGQRSSSGVYTEKDYREWIADQKKLIAARREREPAPASRPKPSVPAPAQAPPLQTASTIQ